METHNINITTFRCDNAGENIKFKQKLVEIGKNINIEFLAPNTPQQNGIVKRAFATLYGRVQSIMNYAFFEGDLQQKLWAECAKTTTELDGILIQQRGKKSNYEKLFGSAPNYLRHLRIFGEIGVVMTPKQEGHKSKIEDKGYICQILKLPCRGCV